MLLRLFMAKLNNRLDYKSPTRASNHNRMMLTNFCVLALLAFVPYASSLKIPMRHVVEELPHYREMSARAKPTGDLSYLAILDARGYTKAEINKALSKWAAGRGGIWPVSLKNL
jgi:hypothetical protein